MPELPEVETITRELSRALAGKKLDKFSVFDAEKISQPRLKLPSRVLGVSRRGKYIVFDLDCGRHCIVHLRMTGELSFEQGTRHIAWSTREKRERARFVFSDGSILYFFDTRRFGTIEWLSAGTSRHCEPKAKQSRELPSLLWLGIEPLSQKFRAGILRELLRRSSRPVKNFLLDQKKIAGIGNIYADEILWTAKIHPLRKANSLSQAEIKRLVLSIKKVLREAIKKGGFTLRDYHRTGGEPGYYQHSRKVYDREGLTCLPRAESRGRSGPRAGTRLNRSKDKFC